MNGPSGVSLWVPESWTIVEPGPHLRTTILQSYPQDKYVGGEPRQPGDTKCDLTIHPPEISVAERGTTDQDPVLAQRSFQSKRSSCNPVSPGIRFELDSMGRSNALVTEINGRVIVLTCFGDFTQFDEIAVTLSAVD